MLDLKGERDKNRLTSDKLWGGMTKFEGLHVSEILWSAPRGAEYIETCLKCFYTGACSIRSKQEELETLAQSQSYDIIGISEAW